ncbi:MAG: right-handed parallel beta-helix repeat-containing protein [Phaeodactylibacter sp.]|nr:right-handed parallel beta-helix repeat-containing protein [Phaeodactylibacter sp.]
MYLNAEKRKTRAAGKQPVRKMASLITVRPIHVLLILLLSLMSCEQAVGGTYYVDSENGNDNYDGRSATYEGGNTGPWKTISMVNQQTFLPGDSILFKRGGVWTDGPLEPRNGGTPGGVVTIEDSVIGQPLRFDLVDPNNNNCIFFGAYGDSPEKPLIDCQGGRGIVLLHNYIIVQGLHIDNGGNNMLWLGRENGTSWVIVDDVDVTNCSANAVRSSYGGGNIWLKGLYVYNYQVNGILLNGSANNKLHGVLVEDCWIENPEVLELEDAITCHRDSEDNDLAGNVIIRNNTTLRAGEDGVDVTSGSNILVEGNTLKFSQAGGVYVNYDWVNYVEVRGNFLYSNSISQGYGDLTIRSPKVRAVNNIIAGNGHHCLLVGSTNNTQLWNNVIAPGSRTGNLIWIRDGISNVELKNNIFDFSTTEQDISGDITSDIVFDNNCYYGLTPDRKINNGLTFEEMRNQNPAFEPHGMWANPQFLNPSKSEPEHFRIANNSNCRDAATAVSLPTDFWGIQRPQGERADLGVHEVTKKAPYAPGAAEGRAWHDKNGNCIPDPGEPGIGKLIIGLYDAKGKFIAMQYSDTNGSYRFEGLPIGEYQLRAVPANFSPGMPLEQMAVSCSQSKEGFFPVKIEEEKLSITQNIAISRLDSPAVKLTSFTAEKGQGGVQLRWSTSGERNLAYFEIERSDNGRDFFLKGHSKAKGPASGRETNYYFTDEEPPGRLTYYRLKQVQKDGRFSYSPLRLANIEEQKGAITVSPTLFSNTLSLSLEEGATADKLWIISQENGKQVYAQPIKDKRKNITIELSSLPAGNYYLIVRSDRERNIQMAFPIVKE